MPQMAANYIDKNTNISQALSPYNSQNNHIILHPWSQVLFVQKFNEISLITTFSSYHRQEAGHTDTPPQAGLRFYPPESPADEWSAPFRYRS